MKCQKCNSENTELIRSWSNENVRTARSVLIQDNETWKCKDCGEENHTFTKRHREW